jgi:hypothetical protein
MPHQQTEEFMAFACTFAHDLSIPLSIILSLPRFGRVRKLGVY